MSWRSSPRHNSYGECTRGRLQEAKAIWRRWERWGHKDGPGVARRSDEALRELTFVCEPEIEEAVNAFEKDGGRLFLDTAHYTGATLYSEAKRLNDEGEPSPGYKYRGRP